MCIGSQLFADGPQGSPAVVSIETLGQDYRPPTDALLAHAGADRGGSTSVRNESAENLTFKSDGYYQRNRDLGQVFVAPRDATVAQLILRIGNTDAAVLAGTPGQEVFVQWFEVLGDPVVNDNGTPRGTEAKHGFSTNHRCDDFIEGVTYQPLTLHRGAKFPPLIPTRDHDGHPTGRDDSRLVHLRFDFETDGRIELIGGQRYALVVGLVDPAPASGFTLANVNRASRPGAVPQPLASESPVGGWGVRREGSGVPKPTLIETIEPLAGSQGHVAMIAESMLPDGPARFDLAPQSDGFPDVDTYRDLWFVLVDEDTQPKTPDLNVRREQ